MQEYSNHRGCPLTGLGPAQQRGDVCIPFRAILCATSDSPPEPQAYSTHSVFTQSASVAPKTPPANLPNIVLSCASSDFVNYRGPGMLQTGFSNFSFSSSINLRPKDCRSQQTTKICQPSRLSWGYRAQLLWMALMLWTWGLVLPPLSD